MSLRWMLQALSRLWTSSAHPTEKEVFVLDDGGSIPDMDAHALVPTHVVGFSGEGHDSNVVVAKSAETMMLVSAVLTKAPPKTPTRVLTLRAFTAEFARKEEDPFVMVVSAELRSRPVVMVLHRRKEGPGFWRGLFSR